MRNTKQREIILNILLSNSMHMTAEEIYKESSKIIPNISLGTVYRNLNILVDNNQIRRIKMPNNIDRFDKNSVHHHIICIKCGCIDDIFENYNIKLPELKKYIVTDYELCFNGICKECIKKER